MLYSASAAWILAVCLLVHNARSLLRRGDLAAGGCPELRITIACTRRPVGSVSQMECQLTGPGDAGRYPIELPFTLMAIRMRWEHSSKA